MENKKSMTIDARLTIVAAVAENGAIGNNNSLLYRLPNDLRRFRQLTVGHTVIMGHNTYRSLPHGALPHRRNIVLSRTASAAACPHCDIFRSLAEALAACHSDEQLFIIGGQTVYQQTIALAARMSLTIIHACPPHADAFFPPYGAEWEELSRETHPADDQHSVPYSFVELIRREG